MAVVLATLIAVISTNSLWGIDFFHVVSGGISTPSTSSWAS